MEAVQAHAIHMIRPVELCTDRPMKIAGDAWSTTFRVWEILKASYDGDLPRVRQMIEQCPQLAYAQFNYTPPIHFAVREGHVEMVDYLLQQGALAPDYRIYPFLDPLPVLARDRGFDSIVQLLHDYLADPSRCVFRGDNGEIDYGRSQEQREFQIAVDKGNLVVVKDILEKHPDWATDPFYFWSEGILTMPAKHADFPMIRLLMQYGAKFPSVVKWSQAYYFERYDSAELILANGADPNQMSWHHVTILHDMGQKGNLKMADLLLRHGAIINVVEDEYQSTPLGMAARWGHVEMVEFLLSKGADPNLSGAPWSAPVVWATKKGHDEIEKLLVAAGALE